MHRSRGDRTPSARSFARGRALLPDAGCAGRCGGRGVHRWLWEEADLPRRAARGARRPCVTSGLSRWAESHLLERERAAPWPRLRPAGDSGRRLGLALRAECRQASARRPGGNRRRFHLWFALEVGGRGGRPRGGSLPIGGAGQTESGTTRRAATALPAVHAVTPWATCLLGASRADAGHQVRRTPEERRRPARRWPGLA